MKNKLLAALCFLVGASAYAKKDDGLSPHDQEKILEKNGWTCSKSDKYLAQYNNDPTQLPVGTLLVFTPSKGQKTSMGLVQSGTSASSSSEASNSTSSAASTASSDPNVIQVFSDGQPLPQTDPIQDATQSDYICQGGDPQSA